jgi:NAD+ synthase (glutamine-hydrolysing)
MAYANKFNKIVLNTSNKSELATGYGTLYGDMIGGLSILGDLYKTQIYKLAHYINTNATIIPISIIEKAPSAELRPNQKDSDSLPEYDILDAILFQLIEEQASVEQVIKNGFDEKLVKRTAQLLTQNEYKRNQFCPILRISSKSFGSGRRIPIVAQLY